MSPNPTGHSESPRLETQLESAQSLLESAQSLLESAQLLHSSLDLDHLLRHLLRSVMGRLLVSKGLIAVEEYGRAGQIDQIERMRVALARGLSQFAVGEKFDAEAASAAGLDLTLPIGDESSPVGLLAIGRPRSRDISDSDVGFLRALLGIAASGIENARAHTEANKLNQALDQKVQELKTLLDLVRGLTSNLEPDDVAQLLMLTLAGRWAVRRYALMAWKKGHPVVLRMKGMELGDLADYEKYEERILKMTEAVRVADMPESDLRTKLIEAKAEAVFPIEAGDETTGGIVVLGQRPGNLSYAESDLEFGMGVVTQAAVAFENSWYFREAVERKKVEQELALAASIQQNLFPARLPNLAHLELAARNRPARTCGGDYYDALQISGETHLICVADVSGKGLPASLLMSNMQATMRALLGRIPSLTELATLTNSLLYATTPDNKYVTAILVELDPETGKGRYVNAGHQNCLLMRAGGEAEWIESTGTPLGLMAPDIIELMAPYSEKSFELHTGDLLALFSDGVTEAHDVDDNEYGEERLADFLRPIRNEPAETLVDKVFGEIDRFAGSAPQYDDITLFIIRRTS